MLYMIGKVSEYNNLCKIGYILGYDELTYFYHQSSVLDNMDLNIGDIVSFNYELDEEKYKLPYAFNIKKLKNKDLKIN